MSNRIRLHIEEGWSVLFLVWSMVFVAGWALREADYLPGLGVFVVVGTVAVLAGLLLAKSAFSDGMATLFAIVYGAALIIYLNGRALPGDLEWQARIGDLFVRQFEWFRKAFSGGTSRDGLIFIMQTSVVFWLLGYTAAWYTFRKTHVWRAVLPSGIVLLSVVYYYYGDKPLVIYLGIYGLLALMYIIRMYLVDQERDWRSAAVRYEPGIGFSFLRAGFLASLIALTIASSLPAMGASTTVGDALSDVGGPWRSFQDNWTRLFSSLRSYGSPSNDFYQGSLVLGGPRTVSNDPIMDIYVEEQLPFVYWQADTLATYEDELWEPLDAELLLHYPEDGPLDVATARARRVITQTVVNYVPNAATMFGAPEIVGSDRQMFVRRQLSPDGKMLVDGIRSRFLLRPGDVYNVRSQISTVDAQSLRQSSTNYPEWITGPYLQLPNTITPETLALAVELASPYDNPFDKAIAVRDYLRQAIKYNDQVAAPPEGMDPVHYTLFIGKEGYCNYYAAAMAVMLRSQGVPTRLVRGYAQGEYMEDIGAYRVRANNAHTWVEVYFPEYGWIQFEPTATIPLVDRPETSGSGGGDGFETRLPFERDMSREELIDDEILVDPGSSSSFIEDAGLDAPGELAGEEGGAVSSWQVAASLLLLAVVGAVFFAANELNRRVEADVERSYGRLGSWARWLGILFRPAQTPYERADALSVAVPEGKTSIRNLTQQFVIRTFGPRHAGEPSYDPLADWKVLRPLLLRRGLAARLARLRRPRRSEFDADRYRRLLDRMAK